MALDFLGWVGLFTHGAPLAGFARGAPLLLLSLSLDCHYHFRALLINYLIYYILT